MLNTKAKPKPQVQLILHTLMHGLKSERVLILPANRSANNASRD